MTWLKYRMNLESFTANDCERLSFGITELILVKTLLWIQFMDFSIISWKSGLSFTSLYISLYINSSFSVNFIFNEFMSLHATLDLILPSTHQDLKGRWCYAIVLNYSKPNRQACKNPDGIIDLNSFLLLKIKPIKSKAKSKSCYALKP